MVDFAGSLTVRQANEFHCLCQYICANYLSFSEQYKSIAQRAPAFRLWFLQAGRTLPQDRQKDTQISGYLVKQLLEKSAQARFLLSFPSL